MMLFKCLHVYLRGHHIIRVAHMIAIRDSLGCVRASASDFTTAYERWLGQVNR